MQGRLCAVNTVEVLHRIAAALGLAPTVVHGCFFRDTLARAISAARRRGHRVVATALDLEQLALADAEAHAEANASNSTKQQRSVGPPVLMQRGAAAETPQPTAAVVY